MTTYLPKEEREERRFFTDEERKKILKQSYGKCACCGKKLTPETMTVEHIIPLSRGGTNNPQNLTALCKDCNKMKGNMLYIPIGFYSALIGTSRLQEMDRYVTNWFHGIRDNFDIERFPLIAPRFNFMINVSEHYKKMKFAKSLLFSWTYVGTDYYEEIEAVTELNLKDIRKEMRNYLEDEKDPEKFIPCAFYSMRKVSSDKILAVIAIGFEKEKQRIIFDMPWTCLPKAYQKSALYHFVFHTLSTILHIAGYQVHQYVILTKYEHGLDMFRRSSQPRLIGSSYKEYEHIDVDTKERHYLLSVKREEDIDELVRKQMTKQMHTS